MSGEIIVIVAATGVVVIVYSIFNSIFSNSNKSKSNDENLPETFKKQLHVKDKESFTNRIDYWIDNGNFQEALKLCKMYHEYNSPDEDINKRIRYLNKQI